MEHQIQDKRTISIGKQNFEDVISHDNFYIDKTHFIEEWLKNDDAITLITRPRRFGKTLLMSMTEHFFSVEYREKAWLFEGLDIFKEKAYRELQGSYPVISLSFASVKESKFEYFYEKIKSIVSELYRKHMYLLDSDKLDKFEKEQFQKIYKKEAVITDMEDSLRTLSLYLYRYYDKKPLILLDEYDTPMQEAYLYGYWEEMVSFIRTLFNATFKTNPYLGRALMTGITRISKESIFSDLNNLIVVTTTSDLYADCFGFTEPEVFHALEQRGLGEYKDDVKRWYDGFTFGTIRDIYNPWSILNFLKTGKFELYWANTSSNGLISRQLQTADEQIKIQMEALLQDNTITTTLDEQIVFEQLEKKKGAIFSLMLAGGYLKVVEADVSRRLYTLSFTNFEVSCMMKELVMEWFGSTGDHDRFLDALLAGDLEAMNGYMNRVSMQIFSYFDTGSGISETERFYHGFVLGLVAEFSGRYYIRSNRESGFGRYDVMMEPAKKSDPAFVFEFKVHNPEKEETLSATADAALKQIREKKYEEELLARGISKEQIRKYGFAFEGKKVLIRED